VRQSTVEVDIAKGPWIPLPGSGLMLRLMLPSYRGMFGLSYAKTIKLEIIKQMIVAVCEEEHYLRCTMSAQQAADMFPLALTDVSRKVRHNTCLLDITNFHSWTAPISVRLVKRLQQEHVIGK
jgi:hypothetical protein